MATRNKKLVPPLHKHSHQWIDARSLEMARAIAETIRGQPGLFEIAKQNLVRWKKIQKPWPHALREWEEIIERHSMEEVLAILTEDSEEGQRLRQSNPFTGILTRQERDAIFERYDLFGA